MAVVAATATSQEAITAAEEAATGDEEVVAEAEEAVEGGAASRKGRNGGGSDSDDNDEYDETHRMLEKEGGKRNRGDKGRGSNERYHVRTSYSSGIRRRIGRALQAMLTAAGTYDDESSLDQEILYAKRPFTRSIDTQWHICVRHTFGYQHYC